MGENTVEVDVTDLTPRPRRRMSLVAIFMPSRAKRRVWDRVAQLELQLSEAERARADLDRENTDLIQEIGTLTTQRDAALRLATEVQERLDVALLAHEQNTNAFPDLITFVREPDVQLPEYHGPRISVYQDMPAGEIIDAMTKDYRFTFQTLGTMPFASFDELGTMVFEGSKAADNDEPVELTVIGEPTMGAEAPAVEAPITEPTDEAPVTLVPVEAASQLTEPDWTGPTRVVISEVTATSPVRSLHDSPLASPTSVPDSQT